MESSYIPSIGTTHRLWSIPTSRASGPLTAYHSPLMEYSDIPSIGTAYRSLLTAYCLPLTAHS